MIRGSQKVGKPISKGLQKKIDAINDRLRANPARILEIRAERRALLKKYGLTERPQISRRAALSLKRFYDESSTGWSPELTALKKLIDISWEIRKANDLSGDIGAGQWIDRDYYAFLDGADAAFRTLAAQEKITAAAAVTAATRIRELEAVLVSRPQSVAVDLNGIRTSELLDLLRERIDELGGL